MRTAHLRLLFLQAVVAVFGAGFESWPHGHNSDSKEMCSAASIDGAFNEFLWWTTHQQLLGAAAQCREALCSSAGIGVKTCPAAVIDTCLGLYLDASWVPHVTDGGVDHHQGCSSYDEGLLRLLLQLGPSGSGADMRTAHLRLLFLQVGEFYRYKIGATVRKSVPEPPGTFVRMLVCAVLSIDEFIALAAVKARLLLSGDVEENPGPISKELEQELARALRCLPQISEAQDKLMKQLEKLETGQQELKDKLQTLECKIDRLAGDLPTASSSEERAELSTQHSQLVDSMRNALLNQDEIENRSRRNNLLFFGLPDEGKETWDEPEKKVIDLCAEKLRVIVSPSAIERAHQIGKVGGEKPRPVIVKFAFFKDKQRVISAASKLKGTNFSIGEDYSKIARQQRQKLLEYGKQTDAKVMVKYNRGRMEAKIGSKSFVYDCASDSVKECAQ